MALEYMPRDGIVPNKTNSTVADLEKTVVITFLKVMLAPAYPPPPFVYVL